MIKISQFIGSRGLSNLEQTLNKRRSLNNKTIPIVSKIIKEIKKDKNKALIKYEKRFSNNNKIKPTVLEINKAIKSLNPSIKKAIDFSFKRIFKYHSLQKIKNIYFKDKLVQ